MSQQLLIFLSVPVVLLATFAGPVLRLLASGKKQNTPPLIQGLALGALLLLVAGHLIPEAVKEHNWSALLWALGWLGLLSLVEYLGGHQHHARDPEQKNSWGHKVGRESLWIALYLHALADGAVLAVATRENAAFALLTALVLHRIAISLSVTADLVSIREMVLRLLPLGLITAVATLGMGLKLPAGAMEHPALIGLLIGGLTHLGNHSYVTHRDDQDQDHRSENIGVLIAIVLLFPLLPAMEGLTVWTLVAGSGLAAMLFMGLARIRQQSGKPFRCHTAVDDSYGVARMPAALLVVPAIFYAPLAVPVLIVVAGIQSMQNNSEKSDDHVEAELPWFLIGLWAAWILQFVGPVTNFPTVWVILPFVLLLLVVDLPWSFWLPIWLLADNLPAVPLMIATLAGSSVDLGYLRELRTIRARIMALALALLAVGLALAGSFWSLFGSYPTPATLLHKIVATQPPFWGLIGACMLTILLFLNRKSLRSRGLVSLLAAINQLTGADHHGHPHHHD